MPYVNAGIKNFEEAEEGLRSGEIFYSLEGSKLFYDEDFIIKGESPYRILQHYRDESDESDPITGLWNDIESWEIKIPWFKNIIKPVPCWVSNSDNDPYAYEAIDLISAYEIDMDHKKPFKGVIRHWQYAKRITKDDITDED